jgi:hypothetical protein
VSRFAYAFIAMTAMFPEPENRLTKLAAELDEYLPAAIKNQALRDDGPSGPGTLKGFHAKIAEVYRLGMSIGWDKRGQADDKIPG